MTAKITIESPIGKGFEFPIGLQKDAARKLIQHILATQWDNAIIKMDINP